MVAEWRGERRERTTRAVAFRAAIAMLENREKRRRKGEGKKGKTRKKLGEWVETMGRWPRAAVSGRQFESEIQKHEARSVENERHLRKRHVGGECDEPEVRTAEGDGTEVG